MFEIYSKARFFFGIMLFVVSSSCVIKSSQLSNLKDLLDNEASYYENNGWSISYRDKETLVYAVKIPEGTLFSNKEGDQVFFDGWSIRFISGLGYSGDRIKIVDKSNLRQFYRNDRLIAEQTCESWRQQSNQNKKFFSQICSNKISNIGNKKESMKREYRNSIVVEENMNISLIRQIVDERYTPLTLTKLK